MMRMKNKPPTTAAVAAMANGGSAAAATGSPDSMGAEWEMRPGGMLVQKRNPDADHRAIPPPTIRVRVKYGSTYHEINISSQASFGELKKMLTGPTGLHHQDQKLMYKDKERDSKAFLDMSGVKDKSKMVLLEDPISQEKRFLEMRKNAKIEKASKSISQISLEVDRLAGRVSALESVISKGGKVAEKDVLSLIELLMNELLKLDGIMGDGDVKLQRKLQVKRVQKYVETLDMLKVKNSSITNGNGNGNGNGSHHKSSNHHEHKQANGHRLAPIEEHSPKYSNGDHHHQQQQQQQHRHSVGHSAAYNHRQEQQQQSSRHSTSGPVVVTTQWETFDSTPGTSSAAAAPPPAAANNAAHNQPKFPWDFFG